MNRIAHAAGYSTGVFYKHFKDNREVFLAAHEQWSIAEWREVATMMCQAEVPLGRSRVSSCSCSFAAIPSGAACSPRSERQVPPRCGEQDVVYLYTTERTFDAIGQGKCALSV